MTAPRPTRRGMLLAVAAMPVMAAPAVAVSPSLSPDARILALDAELLAIRKAHETAGDDESDALAEHEREALNEMAAETATTTEGLAIQARALSSIFRGDPENLNAAHFGLNQPTSDIRLAWAIIAGALKMADAA